MNHTRHKNKTLTVVLPLLLAGCAVHTQKQQHHDVATFIPSASSNVQQMIAADEYARWPQVVRYDRYLLLSTDPTTAQRDPLSQIINIRIPPSLNPTTDDALRYALKQSGYSLCARRADNDILYRQPLPAVQYRMGPMPLRTVLQIMAGPAWQLDIDDVQRVVCHSLRDGYKLPREGTLKK